MIRITIDFKVRFKQNSNMSVFRMDKAFKILYVYMNIFHFGVLGCSQTGVRSSASVSKINIFNCSDINLKVVSSSPIKQIIFELV